MNGVTSMNKPTLMLISMLVSGYAGLGFVASPIEHNVISGYSDTPTFSVPATELTSLEVRLPHENPYNQNPGVALDGFTFKISKVNNVALDTPAAYAAAKQFTVEKARAQGVTAKGEAVTGSEGIVKFNGLEVGLYLIETTVPADRTDKIAVPPMLIILPTTREDGNWSYDVKLNAKPQYLQTPPHDVPPTPPEKPETPKSTPPLALTGASLLGLGISASGFLGAGVLLAQRKYRQDKTLNNGR